MYINHAANNIQWYDNLIDSTVYNNNIVHGTEQMSKWTIDIPLLSLSRLTSCWTCDKTFSANGSRLGSFD